MSRRFIDGWGEAVSEAEMEAADAFWEDWIGDSFSARAFETNPMTGASSSPTSGASSGGSTSPSSLTACVSPTRAADFAANLTPTRDRPRPEICRLLVTKRSGAIAGAPVVDPNGNPTDPSDRSHDFPPGSGAGGIKPGTAAPHIPSLIEALGTGFFIGKDRIVTAAHVVLDALEVIVIPGKMGPASTVVGSAPVPDEPFGRFSVDPRNIAILPDALAAATSPSSTPDVFFAGDLAVIRRFRWMPPYSPFNSYRLASRRVPNTCVHTSGYSAHSVDRNFQHSSTGFEMPFVGPLVDFDLVAEKGASGSPIWQGPDPSTTGRTSVPRRVVGVVVMGRSPTHVGSPVLDAGKRHWLRRT